MGKWAGGPRSFLARKERSKEEVERGGKSGREMRMVEGASEEEGSREEEKAGNVEGEGAVGRGETRGAGWEERS